MILSIKKIYRFRCGLKGEKRQRFTLLVEKPSVFRQFSGLLVPRYARNSAKPQGVGFAGKARLAHELYF